MPKNVFKIFIIGTKNSGLQQLIDYEMSDGFFLDASHISGVDLATKMVQVNKKTWMLQCWIVDIDKIFGRLHDLYPRYLRGTHGAILIVNLGDLNSLNKLEEWISLIRENPKKIPILIVGDRPKVKQNRQISEREGIQFAKEHGLAGYMEIDSYSEFNTSSMFERITSLILKHEDNL
jgi:GTPase SAR1 family protein